MEKTIADYWTCPNCGRSERADGEKCSWCGWRTCPNCGEPMEGECHECGWPKATERFDINHLSRVMSERSRE